MVNFAVKDFITRPHSIELVPVDSEEFYKAAKKAYKKNKKTMNELTN